jgi:hypothetical protein
MNKSNPPENNPSDIVFEKPYTHVKQLLCSGVPNVEESERKNREVRKEVTELLLFSSFFGREVTRESERKAESEVGGTAGSFTFGYLGVSST